MAAIEVEGLTKYYGEIKAVDHISFEVNEGEIFGFLGPNGAGKTTTVKMLTTILKPTSGKALVAGYDVVKEQRKVRKKIGVVFQDPSVDRQLTGFENLYLHGIIYGMSGKELRKRIEEALKFVELSEFANVPLKKYSGGMVRRLEIARAMLHDPEILFLDEPTLGLDPQTRAKVWEFIQELKERGVTVFLTTHYMEEADKLCDRVAIIDHGKIAAIGTPEELKGMIGSEVIYVRINGDPEKFVEICKKSGEFKEVKKIKDEVISLSVRSASTAIPEVFELASKCGTKVEEVKYHRPTLEDVFLHLTGRTLRDSEEGSAGIVKAIMMRRLRRRSK